MARYKKFFKKIWDGWKKIAEKIAVVQTKIILTVLYIAVIGPIAVLTRIFLSDPLGKRKPKKTESFWQDIVIANDTLESCQRQF
ncbi:MAG: hypothetical protein ACE5GM_05295 [bacterium]